MSSRHATPSYPKFSPDSAFIAHSRTTQGSRSTGNGQLWLAAADGSFDKQLAAVSQGNHACLDDGAACNTGTDCCEGTCVVTSPGAKGTCGAQPAGACVGDGDRCAKNSDCCGKARACVDEVCQRMAL